MGNLLRVRRIRIDVEIHLFAAVVVDDHPPCGGRSIIGLDQPLVGFERRPAQPEQFPDIAEGGVVAPECITLGGVDDCQEPLVVPERGPARCVARRKSGHRHNYKPASWAAWVRVRSSSAASWDRMGTMTEPSDNPAASDRPPRVVVVGPDGMAVESASSERGGDEASQRPLTDLVEQPAKVMRIGSMIKQLLEEVKSAPLDEASRKRLREIHRSSIEELEDGLAPELIDELERLTLPFTDESVPTDAELRIAQAQLVGWLEGLFHGIQTTLFAQQMAARAQLEQMRRALPSGAPTVNVPPGPPAPGDAEQRQGGGMYL
jgi:Bacterial proteasome activator